MSTPTGPRSDAACFVPNRFAVREMCHQLSADGHSAPLARARAVLQGECDALEAGSGSFRRRNFWRAVVARLSVSRHTAE